MLVVGRTFCNAGAWGEAGRIFPAQIHQNLGTQWSASPGVRWLCYWHARYQSKPRRVFRRHHRLTREEANLCVGDTDCHAVAPAPLEALALLSKRRLGYVRDLLVLRSCL